MNPRILSQSLTTNPLATAAISGSAPPEWYEPIPGTVAAWSERIDAVRSGSAGDWLTRLAPAFSATGEAKARLEACADGRGVVVTTGQQPGLFGGPVYTLTKALSALTLADTLQRVSGVPVAPVFWAATDDTDFKEASSTVVSVPGGAQLLRIDHVGQLGPPMSAMPLGDVSVQLNALRKAAGSTVDLKPLELLEKFYRDGQTVGSAFTEFLRALFEPLGIAVIDASHAATRNAARSVLTKALASAAEIADRVSERNQELHDAGFQPQVQDVPGLSLVFSTNSGARRRVPIKAARKQTVTDDMGPNVLLRPVVERAILPTAMYIGGPAEIAYFAQVSPIADALGVPRPAIAPRWSCTVIESHVERVLEKLQLQPEDLRDPHEAESRIARARLPKEVLDEVNATRAALNERLDALSEAVAAGEAPVSPAVTGGLRANLMRRLDRFERRLISASKRRHAELMNEIGTARGSLYPLGKPQERALNFVPFLARYGSALIDDMLEGAREHAARIVGVREQRPAERREEAVPARGRA
ncbi:MAG TPA: bacillithiol biosynthesis cysteine-adding enzyme BshC [Gemmatimonadaceae bacterium]|nr:bacillithiol biosynthesis cysteine-adding enzyme BshC [Gemmatimonadaceae bacterium]